MDLDALAIRVQKIEVAVAALNPSLAAELAALFAEAKPALDQAAELTAELQSVKDEVISLAERLTALETPSQPAVSEEIIEPAVEE